jgi:hypothetical protein
MDPNTTNALMAAAFRTPVTTCQTVMISPERCTIRSSNGICLLGFVPAQYGTVCTTQYLPL